MTELEQLRKFLAGNPERPMPSPEQPGKLLGLLYRYEAGCKEKGHPIDQDELTKVLALALDQRDWEIAHQQRRQIEKTVDEASRLVAPAKVRLQ